MSSTNKPGLVSVVVASYNHAGFLVRRMESLIGQTYQDIEILVIDDCSTDGSAEVLRRYASHPKVRVTLRERNGGWVAVSNQGVGMSGGEYVIFANCDDDCDPRMIERLVHAFQRYPSAGISFCRSLMIDEDSRVLGDDFLIRESSFRKRCGTDTLIERKEMGRFLLHSCVIPNLSAALISKKCIESVGLLTSEYQACSDWSFFFNVVRQFDFAYVAEPLNRFRQHAATIRSVMKGRATYEEYFRLLLGQLQSMDVTFTERCRYRSHVMYLWAMHLLAPAQGGVKNFPFHLKQVLSLDPLALIFLPSSLVARVARIVGKHVAGLLSSRGESHAQS